MELSDERIDRVFHALAAATRRDILRRTIEREHSVSALAREYDMSFAAVQKHVAVLEEAGLIVKRAEGRERLVRADPDMIARARVLLAPLRRAVAVPHRPPRRPPRRNSARYRVFRSNRHRKGLTMPVTDVTTDPEALTMTLTAEVAASVDRLWAPSPTPASSSGSGALPATPPPSPNSTCRSVGERTTG